MISEWRAGTPPSRPSCPQSRRLSLEMCPDIELRDLGVADP